MVAIRLSVYFAIIRIFVYAKLAHYVISVYFDSMDSSSTKVIKNKRTDKYELICLETGEVLQKDIHQLDFSGYKFDETKASLVCELLTEGKSMMTIAQRQDTPPLSVIQYWRRKNPIFDEEVRWARKARAEYFHDQVLDLAENIVEKDDIPVAKFKAEQYKWAAEKGDPSTFGNKVEHTGKIEGGQTLVVVTGIDRSVGIKEIESEVIDGGQEVSSDEQPRTDGGLDQRGVHEPSEREGQEGVHGEGTREEGTAGTDSQGTEASKQEEEI